MIGSSVGLTSNSARSPTRSSGMHQIYFSQLANATYIFHCGLDITLARSGHYTSILRIRCSRRHLMTARFKSSMRACIATSLQILSSCRSRSCAGTTYVMVWAFCRLDGFPSNHGWSAQERIAPSPSGAINDELVIYQTHLMDRRRPHVLYSLHPSRRFSFSSLETQDNTRSQEV